MLSKLTVVNIKIIPRFTDFSRIILCLIFLGFFSFLHAQELNVPELNNNDYPVIQARYVLTDVTGAKVTDLTLEDVEVTENGDTCEVVYVSNPAEYASRYSILLVFDISGSMNEKRLSIAREAARSLVEEMDLQESEIAITTFNDESYLDSDFTQIHAQINETIEGISQSGGTSYTNAFTSEYSGVFEVMKTARYKKVVVFMTDGLGSVDQEKVLEKAKEDNITVFCSTIELAMPPVLKSIAYGTGGDVFPKVNDAGMARAIYKNLYRHLSATDYGIIRWFTPGSCDERKGVHLKARGTPVSFEYFLPVDSVNRLMVMPPDLFVRQKPVDSIIHRTITLYAPHTSIEITDIAMDKAGVIELDAPEVPFLVDKGSQVPVKINFPINQPPGSSIHLNFSTSNCLYRAGFRLDFGESGKIQVVHPQKNDVYAVGTDTSIQWTGVSPLMPVSLFYKKNTEPWQKIADATGLHYPWTVPMDSASDYQVMAIPKDNAAYEEKLTLPGNLRHTEIMDISGDGSMILTRDNVGMTRVWSTNSTRPLNTFRDAQADFMYFSQDSRSVFSYSGSMIRQKSIFENRSENFIQPSRFKVFGCFPTLYGDEYRLPSDVIHRADKSLVIRNLNTGNMIELAHGDDYPVHAAFCADQKHVVLLNQNYSLDIYNTSSRKMKRLTRKGQLVQKAFASPYGTFIYIEQPDWRGIIETRRGKTVLDMNDAGFIRFSPTGRHVLIFNSVRKIALWDLEHQQKVVDFTKPKYFNFSYHGNRFYFTTDTSLVVCDLGKNKQLVSIPLKIVDDLSMSPSGNELCVIQDGHGKLFTTDNGSVAGIVNKDKELINKAAYSVNNQIFIINSNYSVSILEPASITEAGISDTFSVIAPKPDVIPEYDFGEVPVGQMVERVVPDFIQNQTPFVVMVESLEFQRLTQPFEIVSHPGPYTIEKGKTLPIELRFSPPESRPFTDTLMIKTPGGYLYTKITGQGIKSPIKTNQKDIDFGKVKLNEAKDTALIVISNISEKQIQISNLEIAGQGDFKLRQEPVFPILLQAKESLTLRLRFSPRYAGRRNGAFKITVSRLPKPVMVRLFGEGVGQSKIVLSGITKSTVDSSVIKALVLCRNIVTGNRVHQDSSTSAGIFNVELLPGGNYLFHAEKEGYISSSESIDLTHNQFPDTIHRTIWLTRTEPGNSFHSQGVFFEFAKSEILPSSADELDRIFQWLKKNPDIRIEIQGHTDAVGSDEYNMQLSLARARAVQAHLNDHGISLTRLLTKGFGEIKPVATNDTEEGRQMNRRVEFVILGKKR
ncbi:MAG: OmpA family protein [Bacteroidota bacterium]